MTDSIKHLPERRLSMKIIAHRVKRHFPPFVYAALLHWRYATFPKQCKSLSLPEVSYSDGSWTKKKATADLIRITEMLKAQPRPLEILQIGIGNSSLFSEIGAKTKRFVGLTIVQDEIRFAQESFPTQFGTAYETRLMNKYSADVQSIDGTFDYIVDNDLSSYACCRSHFNIMLEGYFKLLKPNGAVLVGINGLGYFDSGFGLTMSMIEKLAPRFGLTFIAGEQYHMLKKQA